MVEKLHTVPATTPKITSAHNGITPEDGVAATNPEIHPEHAATISHFCSSRKSNNNQVAAPNAAHKCVFIVE